MNATSSSDTARRDLIIDVGMHVGQDTAYYLEKGFDVVAVEANPALVAAAQERFAAEIESGRLRVIHAAIAETEGPQQLAIATGEHSIWSSLDARFIARNQRAGTSYSYVEVPGRRFESILEEVGVPYYLKVDVEGMDMLCVRALRAFEQRPPLVSIESAVSANDAPAVRAFDEIAELWTLGYREFKYVDQSRHRDATLPYPPREGRYVDTQFGDDASGPFGAETRGRWLSAQAAVLRGEMLRLEHNVGGFGGRWGEGPLGRAYRGVRRAIIRSGLGWYDLHARLPARIGNARRALRAQRLRRAPRS